MNLYDLIVYDLTDGDTIAKYSAEHLTLFHCDSGGILTVESTQHERTHRYNLARCGFFFTAR